MSILWFLTPFFLQGGAMMVDEMVYHRRRGLPRWERVGHPMDTLSVLAVFAIVWFLVPTRFTITLYALTALASTFLITKDEWIHHRFCTAAEQWLHSVLFGLHAWVFVALIFLWAPLHGSTAWIEIRQAGSARIWVAGEISLLIGFLVYQVFYWNGPWQPTHGLIE